MSDDTHRPFARHEILSRSESGLHYVRERRSGILRRLTDDELADFNDPPPCERCGEQFGCDHFNCAREPMLTEAEIDAEMPENWKRFAREEGVSRNDIERLKTIERDLEGVYRTTAPSPDMRLLELVLVLNEG
jgi:hypothetical protein